MTETLEELTPNSDGSSMDMTPSLIDQLRPIVPEAFTEGKIDFDVLRSLLGGDVDARTERYCLNWHGKSRARRIAHTASMGTLRPCPQKSVKWDTTKNIFIEGDNLEVLKLLQKSYHKRVKMIYIDPPYNTGNEFIYPDKFQDNLDAYLRYTGQVGKDGLKVSANSESGGRYHTNWLNMMYPRLKLARNLLRDDGAIFVTIDDHEFANLRLVMDEIWGDENFVATIAWQKVFAKKNKALISSSHDHVLAYARRIECWERNLLPRDDRQLAAFKNPDDDPRGDWQSVSFSVQSEDSDRRKAYRYEISLPSGRSVRPPTGRHWNGLPDRFQSLLDDNRIWFGKEGDSPPRCKLFLSEVQAGIVPDTWWDHEDAGNNQDAKKEILELFGESEPFSTPKPVRLILKMLRMATLPDNEDIVLDFFAGSGTTAHAVGLLNSADKGNRRFIMVQLPEPTGRDDFPTIADIALERIKRAFQHLDSNSAADVFVDSGVKAYELTSSNVRPWNPDSNTKAALLDSLCNLVAGRTAEDVVTELLLKCGLDLAVPIETRFVDGASVFIVDSGALVAVLENKLTGDVIECLSALKDELQPEFMRVVLRDSGFPDEVAKTNAVQFLRQRGIDDVKSL